MQPETQWQQVMARDARQDGRFVFAVRTTGIYCRPSCPSRRPRRDSVEFFADPQQAERAGYRACLRCKPTEISAQARAVIGARQLLDEAEGVMTLAELSKRVGISSFHLQRLFFVSGANLCVGMFSTAFKQVIMSVGSIGRLPS